MTNRDKLTKTESAPIGTGQVEWPHEDEEQYHTFVAEVRRRVRVMISRAAIVYLVLFLAVGILMSVAGANPLANEGLMPKILLAFVGLGLLIALGNTLIDFSREQGRNLLRLARHKNQIKK